MSSGMPKNINILKQLFKLGPKKAIIILISAALIYFINGGNIPTQNSNSTVTQTEINNSDIVSGIVTRVVDGDTAVIKVDGQERRVRLLGVDTPETVHPNKPVQFFGNEASSFTKKSLNGRQVWLEYDENPQDRYKRHLVYLWLSKPSVINENTIREYMFNARLLLGGYAKVMIIKPNKRYEALFKKFQDEAKKSRLGVWQQ